MSFSTMQGFRKCTAKSRQSRKKTRTLCQRQGRTITCPVHCVPARCTTPPQPTDDCQTQLVALFSILSDPGRTQQRGQEMYIDKRNKSSVLLFYVSLQFLELVLLLAIPMGFPPCLSSLLDRNWKHLAHANSFLHKTISQRNQKWSLHTYFAFKLRPLWSFLNFQMFDTSQQCFENHPFVVQRVHLQSCVGKWGWMVPVKDHLCEQIRLF